MPSASPAPEKAGTSEEQAATTEITAQETENPATPQPSARHEVIETIMGFIRNSNAAGLSAISTLTLVLVAIGLLSTIEATFNDIWGVTRGRSWFARIIQYWAAITLGPTIILFATTFAVGTQFETFQDKIFGTVGLSTIRPFLTEVIARLLPLVLVSVAFALLYQLMPATAVHWKAAAVGALPSCQSSSWDSTCLGSSSSSVPRLATPSRTAVLISRKNRLKLSASADVNSPPCA